MGANGEDWAEGVDDAAKLWREGGIASPGGLSREATLKSHGSSEAEEATVTRIKAGGAKVQEVLGDFLTPGGDDVIQAADGLTILSLVAGHVLLGVSKGNVKEAAMRGLGMGEATMQAVVAIAFERGLLS